MINITKRKFLLSMGIFSVFLHPLNLLSIENNDYLLKGPLAGSLYYTKEKPGRWQDVKASHIPIVNKNLNFLEVTTPHEMRGFEHYIIKHIVLDKKFKIISEKNFDPSKDRAYSKHNISGYSETLYVLSICNLHDTWLEPVNIN